MGQSDDRFRQALVDIEAHFLPGDHPSLTYSSDARGMLKAIRDTAREALAPGCPCVGTPVPMPDQDGDWESRVRERMDLLRREHPGESGPDGNWLGYAYAEHDEGECVECDALRRLAQEDDQ